MCPAREGGWGQGSHHSPAEALARPAGPALYDERASDWDLPAAPLPEQVQGEVDDHKAGKDHIRACKETKFRHLCLGLGLSPANLTLQKHWPD